MARSLSPEEILKNRERVRAWKKLNPKKRALQNKRYYANKKEKAERLKQENEELKKQLENIHGTQQTPPE